MKTVIIFDTHHGTTAKVADILKQKLTDQEVTIINLSKNQPVDLYHYQTIIIGGSIHAGRMSHKVKTFMRKNMVVLLQKRLALFMVGMNEPEISTQIEREFPELLRNHAINCHWVGGEFLFGQMNFIEKWMIKQITGITQSVSKIKYEAIEQLVSEIG